MKINEASINEYIRRNELESKEKPSVKSDNFRNLLVDELDSQASSATVDSSGESVVVELAETLPTVLLLGIEESQNVLSEAGSAVSQLNSGLDSILRKLDQQDISLNTLESVVSSLSAEAENLSAYAGEIADQSALKGLSDELNVLAYVESVKWQRGDYI
jgi:hypothetical protein